MKLHLCLALGTAAFVAQATTITFDEFGTQPSTFDAASPVNDRYLAQGVRFRGPNNSTEIGGMMLNDSTFTVHAHSGNNFMALTTTMGPETLTFTNLQSHVSIYAASVVTGGGHFLLTAFDTGGTQIGSDSLVINRDTWGQMTVDAPGIKKVVISESSAAFTYVYDDLNFSSVPEPATLGLFVLAIPALLRRKRK